MPKRGLGLQPNVAVTPLRCVANQTQPNNPKGIASSRVIVNKITNRNAIVANPVGILGSRIRSE